MILAVRYILRIFSMNNNIDGFSMSGIDAFATAADDDGPDTGTVQVHPYCSHPAPRVIQAHIDPSRPI